MTEQRAPGAADRADEPQCDCGYMAHGENLGARVRDAQRHARDAHGIDVPADQVLVNGDGDPT